MPKIKKIFVCSNCGASFSKWEGKCSSCGEWNTLTEELVSKDASGKEGLREVWKGKTTGVAAMKPVKVSEIKHEETQRMSTPDDEFNRVLGGGIVPGSLILMGGQPGIGKSTLLLQIAMNAPFTILYVSGEESKEQIKMRADRVASQTNECYIYTETNVEKILKTAGELTPRLLVIDSIQTMRASYLDATPGSISQIRECTGELQRFAKETNIPVIIIGHITKDGAIAGPKLLEHIVDTVLQFEGDRHYTYRIIRTLKNRFGSTDELGIYEMQSTGLREVRNPSELLLSQSEEELSGTAIAATLEGVRPILIETQTLVSKAVYGTPQRSATGFDLRRLSMLLAVLEKRCGFPFGLNDVFLNLAGGIRIDDPALDLSIVSALLSSFEDISIPASYCFAGEIGLSGEIRAVNKIDQRIQEADRLGFKKIFLSKYNKGVTPGQYKIQIVQLGKVEELYQSLFES